MLDPRIDGEQTPCRYRIPTRQVVDLDLQDAEKMSGLRRLCDHKPRTTDRRLVYVCGAGEGSFYIDPCGRMSMCGLTRYAAYDLSSGSFKQGFYDHFEALRSQRLEEGEIAPCAECNLINLCTNCPGTAYLENASLTRPSPFHCEVARLRAREVASLR
jgi:radical SAM protein with 4Fe4S-binding SPASM domain